MRIEASVETWEVTQLFFVALRCEATLPPHLLMVLLKSTPPRSKLSLHYTDTYFKKVAFGYVLPVLLCLPLQLPVRTSVPTMLRKAYSFLKLSCSTLLEQDKNHATVKQCVPCAVLAASSHTALSTWVMAGSVAFI